MLELNCQNETACYEFNIIYTLVNEITARLIKSFTDPANTCSIFVRGPL